MLIDDETLMALADGELEHGMAERVRAAIAADPALQARLRVFVETRRALRETAAQSGPAPGDDALIARIRAASMATQPATAPGTAPTLQPGPATVRHPANLVRRPLAGLAAALLTVVIGLVWWWPAGGPDAAIPASQIAALQELMSGETRDLPDGSRLTMIASYRTGGGALCREYETHAGTRMTVMVACRNDDGWTRHFATDITASEDYIPAAGEIEALDAFLAQTAAGAPLGPAQEVEALAN
ncbi:anti-sigma factor family protein [Paracoccus salsus]|uniref:anti-sigma factor family protein n=1 Tax=Paracoccus salsus TaxID=2911061 RepID=UPI001F427252|nr:sigma-E factor negative regulatory protein [Paracoccus salsus]MCF3974276.1 sigma-E factor negative regulatory protein [Paracoccus salsus]